jgi:CBS domain-containing protein
MHASVTDIVSQKGREVHTITPEKTVSEAVAVMAQHNIGALVVVEGGRPIGMLSERDVLWRIVHEARAPGDTQVSEVMTRDIITVRMSTQVSEAMRVMTARRVRHLPVLDREQLAGLVSIGDVTKWLTRDLESQVGDLETYIHGPYVQPPNA